VFAVCGDGELAEHRYAAGLVGGGATHDHQGFLKRFTVFRSDEDGYGLPFYQVPLPTIGIERRKKSDIEVISAIFSLQHLSQSEDYIIPWI